MRIIAGEARGRRLVSPDGTDTRPAADKTRESLFSILSAEIPGAKVLDLFGGTGALALEAMSRGAESAVICEISPKAAKCISQNILTVMKDAPGVRLIRSDYRQALETLKSEKFDLVFLDPPYRMTEAYIYSVQRLTDLKMLSPEAVIVAEREAKTRLDWPTGVRVYDTRTYRDTAVDFLTPEGIE